MDGLREEMIEDIYGIERSCSGCMCENCLRRFVEYCEEFGLEVCYANCYLGFPCHTWSCDDYIGF